MRGQARSWERLRAVGRGGPESIAVYGRRYNIYICDCLLRCRWALKSEPQPNWRSVSQAAACLMLIGMRGSAVPTMCLRANGPVPVHDSASELRSADGRLQASH